MIHIDKSRKLQIFDLGGVIIDVDARKTFAAFEALGMPHRDIQVSNSHAVGGVFSAYCDGLISTDEFISGVRDVCRIPQASDQQIIDAWNAMLGNYRPDAIELVRSLRAEGFATALLSNCNALHTEACRAAFPGPRALDDLFDATFFSQEIHVSKPQSRAWTIVLNHFGISADAAAFYDDSAINVEAASALGIAASVVE